MHSKYFSMLAAVALVVPSAFAQTSATNLPDYTSISNPTETFSQTPAMPQFWAGPAIHAPGSRLNDSSSTSLNWDGYVVTGTDFTSVKGSWTVPAGTCSKSPNSLAYFWIGIDGWTSSTVEQTGTATFCNKTTVSYWSWYEFYPAAPVVVSSVPVKAGDKISAQVSYANSEFTIEITDETTGKKLSITKSVTGADRNSAEWIAEAPTGDSGIVNLADFTDIGFGDDHTGISGTNYATDSAHSGPISAFGTSTVKVTQIDWLNYTEAAPSALSSEGTSFTTTWVEPN